MTAITNEVKSQEGSLSLNEIATLDFTISPQSEQVLDLTGPLQLEEIRQNSPAKEREDLSNNSSSALSKPQSVEHADIEQNLAITNSSNNENTRSNNLIEHNDIFQDDRARNFGTFSITDEIAENLTHNDDAFEVHSSTTELKQGTFQYVKDYLRTLSPKDWYWLFKLTCEIFKIGYELYKPSATTQQAKSQNNNKSFAAGIVPTNYEILAPTTSHFLRAHKESQQNI
jgi:hypothetical protein